MRVAMIGAPLTALGLVVLHVFLLAPANLDVLLHVVAGRDHHYRDRHHHSRADVEEVQSHQGARRRGHL